MTPKEIESLTGKFHARITHDSEFEEYKVSFWTVQGHLTDADYFTDDKQDAIDTALSEMKHMEEKMVI